MLIYCLKCKSKKEANNIEEIYSKNNKPMVTGICSSCGSKLYQFIKKGKGVINTLLNKIPIPELHLSLPKDVSSENIENGSFNKTGKYSYCGPGTKLNKRLKEGYKGINDLDKACHKHDLAYDEYKDTENRNTADNELAQEANRLANDMDQPSYVRKDAKRVAALMSAKSWLGMGNNS
jgi:predicted  nucleic acid-binding Zn-ribbon protein